MNSYILVTSNKDKLAEFRRFGIPDLQIEEGEDLKEVQADSDTVAIYKAKDAGLYRIVEDTSFDVVGADIGVNIRWEKNRLDELTGKRAVWKVLIAVHNERSIDVYEGVQEGIISNRLGTPDDAFGFDAQFIPDGSDLTLYELNQQGKKDLFSARKIAIENMCSGIVKSSFLLTSLPDWKGSYQGE